MFHRLLSRLSVGKKLLLIYLLDLSAVIFVSGVLINEKFIAIDFSRKEIQGNEYIAAIREPLMDLVGDGGLLAGQLQRPGLGKSPLQEVEEAQVRYGEGMRSAEPNAAFARALAPLQALDRSTEATDMPAQARALSAGRALITRIGNQSNLILDPDLDSYYTMSLILLRFPELLEASFHSMHHLRRSAEPGKAFDSEARTAHLMNEGRLDAVADSIQSDFSEAFAAASDSRLRAALDDRRIRLVADINQFRRAARAVVEHADGASQLAAAEEARLLMMRDLRDTWTASAQQLDRLMKARVEGFFQRMWLHLGTALFLLGIILTAVFHVARQISSPLRQLSQVADTVRRTGDHSLRAVWRSSDEIGRLVFGFNDMLAQLDRERQVQQELAATARAAAAQQDMVEATPIAMVVTAVPGHEVLHANAPAQHWLRDPHSDPWARGFEPGVRARFFQELADKEAVDQFEARWNGPGGSSWAMLSARRLVFQGQDAILTAFSPINQLKAMEMRLELWAKVFEASSEGILIVDRQHLVITVNRSLCKRTGHEFNELAGCSPDMLLLGEDGRPALPALWAQIDARGAWQGVGSPGTELEFAL